MKCFGGVGTLVLVEGDMNVGHSGGTHRYLRALEKAASGNGISSFRVRSLMALAEQIQTGAIDLDSTCLVFCQEEGQLSEDFRNAAGMVLATGCSILEKNVFNLPSRWRPRNDRYIMVCTSRDGLWRWRIRSAFSRRAADVRAAVIPNLIYGSSDELTELQNRRKVQISRSDPLTIYRQGRPTLVKWTTYETRVLRKLNRRLPSYNFAGRARGVPSPLVNTFARAGFTVLEFSEDPVSLQEDWLTADLYVHYSKIGESLGVSVLEASAIGVPVMFAISPFWDQGAVEYVKGPSLIGSRKKVLRDACKFVVQVLELNSEQWSDFPLQTEIWVPESHLSALVAAPSLGERVPLLSAIRSMVRTQVERFGVSSALAGLCLELLRGARAALRGR